jgi:serine/threonine protein kinase
MKGQYWLGRLRRDFVIVLNNSVAITIGHRLLAVRTTFELRPQSFSRFHPDTRRSVKLFGSHYLPHSATITKMNSRDFLTLLEKSRLLTDDQLAALKNNVQDSVDAQSLARQLIKRNWLTLWQARRLLSGRTGFFFNKYRLLDCLGRGGMGAVYKAHHPFLDRTVALKVVLNESPADANLMARFQREMRSVAALNHPNIIAAHDADVAGKTPFLVMEFIEGKDLQSWIDEQDPLPIDWSCECIYQASLGLQHAHERGLVHRDIKPSNLLVVQASSYADPTIKILDFGLAQLRRGEEVGHDLTQTGQLMGTIDYIAPEQARSTKHADIRSDIFSLGCTFYRMLSGTIPFPGDSVASRLAARFIEDAPPLSKSRADCPRELEELVHKMLQRDPGQRYQSPVEVADALRRFTRSGQREQDAARPPGSEAGLQETESFADRTQPKPRPSNLPQRGQSNDQLTAFYRGIGMADGDLCNCAACNLVVPRNAPPPGTIGVNILQALQTAPQSLMSFALLMKQVLGDKYVNMPAEPVGMMSFLNQFVAAKCSGCGSALCPACRVGHASGQGCILCGQQVTSQPMLEVSGPTDLTVAKMHAATIAATIAKLDTASDQEFREIQQIVLGSAIKMAQDARAGSDVQFLGLALREFCSAVESRGGRPIEHAAITQIRILVDQSVPVQIDPAVIAEFRKGIEHVR